MVSWEFSSSREACMQSPSKTDEKIVEEEWEEKGFIVSNILKGKEKVISHCGGKKMEFCHNRRERKNFLFSFLLMIHESRSHRYSVLPFSSCHITDLVCTHANNISKSRCSMRHERRKWNCMISFIADDDGGCYSAAADSFQSDKKELFSAFFNWILASLL